MASANDSASVNNPSYRPSPSSLHSNPHYLAWTPAHERRLLIVQAQLAKAQAEWSDEQEIWLDEVSNTLLPPIGVRFIRQPKLDYMDRDRLNGPLR